MIEWRTEGEGEDKKRQERPPAIGLWEELGLGFRSWSAEQWEDEEAIEEQTELGGPA